MSTDKKIITPEDETWLRHVETNAKHRAKLFIDSGNFEKAAKALRELPYKGAIEFLYNLGKKFLHHHDKRAETVVKTSELIEKKNISEIKNPHGVHAPIVKRYTVAEIFKD